MGAFLVILTHEVLRIAEQRLAGHDGRHEPNLQRAFRANHLPGKREFNGSAKPHEAGETDRASVAGNDAETDLGLTEAGVLARDAEVARQGELAAASQRVPPDRRKHWLREALDRQKDVLTVPADPNS